MEKEKRSLVHKYTLLFVVVLLAISSCESRTTSCYNELSSQPRFKFDEMTDYNDLKIKLDFATKGNAYSLTILGNKTYHYLRRSPIKEEFEGVLVHEKLLDLIKGLEDNKFNYMKERYSCSKFYDLGSSEIILIFNNKTISVFAYGNDGPSEFYTIKNRLLNVLNDNGVRNE